MACKGTCTRYKAAKPEQFGSRYEHGQKRCSVCDIFVNWEGRRCPCCGMVLRTRPKGTQTRERLLEVRNVKRI